MWSYLVLALVAAAVMVQPAHQATTKDGRDLDIASETAPTLNTTSLPPLGLGYKKFYVFPTQADWHQALHTCYSNNLRLATINSALEQDMQANFIRSIGLAKKGTNFWLSGTNLVSGGEYYWMGTGQLVTYKNWRKYEPNNDWSGTEHCMEMVDVEDDFTWNDARCFLTRYFICEDLPRKCSSVC